MGVAETTTRTETRTDSSWVRIADASCASSASDREPGLVYLLYRGHHPSSRGEEEVDLVVTSARSSVLAAGRFSGVGKVASRNAFLGRPNKHSPACLLWPRSSSQIGGTIAPPSLAPASGGRYFAGIYPLPCIHATYLSCFSVLHAVKAPTNIERAALCTWWSQSFASASCWADVWPRAGLSAGG